MTNDICEPATLYNYDGKGSTLVGWGRFYADTDSDGNYAIFEIQTDNQYTHAIKLDVGKVFPTLKEASDYAKTLAIMCGENGGSLNGVA